ncbi:MAG TPA: GntR family transcriptional regulator [Mycobacteriales bacterium]|nr:GntR family transcriptional regulator [Mycobacteriales bacterium]
MIVEIDPTSSTPAYEQLVTQIEGVIVSGALPADHRLPPIRQLSEDLHLAPGTVARAYRELEQLGLIESRGRHGTFVRLSRVRPDRRRKLVEKSARAFAQQARQLGLDRRAALQAVEEAWSGT